MKLKLLILGLSFAFIWVLMTCSPALAVQQSCSGLSVNPSHGTAGSAFTASIYVVPYWTPWVNFLWDNSDLLDSVSIAGPSTVTAHVAVPADAAVGVHQVWAYYSVYRGQIDISCYTNFTVDPPSVQQNAYGSASAPVSSLPSTGFFLLIPAAGLGIGGLGGAMVRRRRRGLD